jgi:hypothetical protein
VFFTLLPCKQSRARNDRFWPLVAEDGSAAWQRPAAPTPSQGPASDSPLSWRLVWARRRTGHGLARQGRRRRYSRRARAWSLEAEGKALATRSSSSYSRWGSWQRTLAHDSSSVQEEMPRGTGSGAAEDGGDAPKWTAARDRGCTGDGGDAMEWGGRTTARCGEAETTRGGVGNFVFLWEADEAEWDATSNGADARV